MAAEITALVADWVVTRINSRIPSWVAAITVVSSSPDQPFQNGECCADLCGIGFDLALLVISLLTVYNIFGRCLVTENFV